MSWYNPTKWGGKITPIHTKRGEGGRPASGEKPSDRIEQKPESKSLGKIVEEMRSDYQVSFCERILGANIAAIQVTASGETVSEELTEALQTLWDRTLSSMLDSIAYGRVAYELEWKNDGVYQVPCRAEPLPFELSRMNLCDGRFDGIEVKTKSGQWEPIDVMNSWWLAIDATVVQPHGRSRFLPAPYEVYKDKRGAKKNRQTATSKWGTRGPIMRGPQTDFDPQTQQPFDVLPELSPAVDVWSAGGMLYLSNDRDPASKDGNEYKYAVEQAELAGFDPTAINDTIERMDVEMARAFGIAEQTIMEAGGVGTYGSITQKMLLLFAVCEGILDQWCRSFEKYVIAKVLAVNGLPAESITLSYTSLAQRPDAFIFEAIKILLANPQFVEAIMAGGVDIKAMLEDAGFPVTEQLAAVMATIAQRMAATAAAGAPPIGAAPAGEMSGLGRRQWQNNRKAINDVLQDVISGSTSEVMAKELLQSLGVPPERAQVFIDDAKDGKVDDAELTAPATMSDHSQQPPSMTDYVESLTGDIALRSDMLDDGLHHHFIAKDPERSAGLLASKLTKWSPTVGGEAGLWTVMAVMDGKEHMFHFIPADGTSGVKSMSDFFHDGSVTLAQVPIPRQGFKVPDTAQVLNAGLREFDRLFDELITAMSKRASQATLNGIRQQIVALEAELRTVCRLLGMLSPWQPRAVTYAGGQVPKQTEALPVTLADNAYKFPWIEDAVAFLESKGVVTTEQFARMAEADRRTVFHAPGIDTAKQLKSVQAKLVKSFEAGDDLRTFRKSIEADVALTRAQTETMYRTETKRGFVAGLDKALSAPLVRDEFPAVMFSATADQRVRDSHWDLDGTVCLRTDPMYKRLVAAANEHNCRCTIIPLSLEDAVARGLVV